MVGLLSAPMRSILLSRYLRFYSIMDGMMKLIALLSGYIILLLRLLSPGGLRAIAAENIVLRQQLSTITAGKNIAVDYTRLYEKISESPWLDHWVHKLCKWIPTFVDISEVFRLYFSHVVYVMCVFKKFIKSSYINYQ